MPILTPAQWSAYKAAIDLGSGIFNKDIITWRSLTMGLDYNGEDGLKNSYTNHNLECLISYNYFRVWPIISETMGGQFDKNSIVCLLNKHYMDGLGFTNIEGQFSFKPGEDIFVLRGEEYRCGGYSHIAQANDEPLMFMLILKRQEILTGKPPI
jgi:hypothetical protein